MSFASRKSLSQSVGAFVGIIVLSLVIRSFWAGGFEELMNPKKQVENAVVASLQENPGNVAVLEAMERHFPHDYDDLLDAMTNVVSADGTSDQISMAGGRQISSFLAKHRSDFAFAPLPALDAVLAAEIAVIDALSDTPAVCSDYFFGSPQNYVDLPPEGEALAGKAISAKISAMSEGRRKQELRLKVTPRDHRALHASIAQNGASEDQRAVLTDEIAHYTLDDDVLCDAGRRFLEGMAAQPDERRALLIGEFLNPGNVSN